MSKPVDNLLAAALALPDDELAELANRLAESMHPPPDATVSD